MMKNITLKLKHLVLVSTLAMFATSASAVTYSLTTHVDGRTETATINLAAGADLLSNMPQKLWRAYCEYSFYSDAEMTQEITEVPADAETVYVDYVFDPPFILSEEGKDPVYNYLRTYNYSGSNNYLVIYDQAAENEWGTYKETILSWKSVSGATPKAGRNYPIAKAGHDQWAFYGDAYDFQIRLNDATIANNYLIWRSTTRNETPMGLGAKPTVGWQLYVNTAENGKMSGTMAMGPYGVTNYLASLENVNSCVWTDKLTTSEQYFDSHNQLVYKPGGTSQTTMNKNNLWWYAFFATPVTSPANSTDIWHVTYKIQKVDGSWYDDIVVQKKSSNLKPSFPPAGFEPSDDYAYDYFYLDADFAEKCAKDYAMPATGNTVLYLRELEFVSTPWMTLVLPYDIEDLDAHFGDGAVMVNEYSSVTAEMTEAGGETYFNCHLNFSDVQQIEAYKPYLFKALRVNPVLLDEMYYTVEDMQEPIEIKLYDDANAANIGVSMKGVLAEEGYEMPGDGLNFYFGAVEEDGDYSYNFYRRAATIPQFRCYFFVTDERTDATPIKVRFGSDSFTGISSMTADTKVNTSVYTLDGRKLNGLDNLKKGIYIVNGRKVVK